MIYHKVVGITQMLPIPGAKLTCPSITFRKSQDGFRHIFPPESYVSEIHATIEQTHE
jgi:hypothetical protein